MMAYQTNTESCATPLNCALTMLRQLPIRLTNNPWPTPPMSCPIVPLERFIPLFTIFATANLQFQFVANVAPLLYVNRNGNNFTCVSLKTFSPTLPKFQTFTSFNDFNGGDTLPASLRSDPKNMRDAFLMLSFSIKCTQLTSCFGMVVLKMFHTHHMTYGGERIIGWAIQDGYMDSKHPEFGEMEILFVRNSNDSVKIVECLNNNEEVPRDLADRVPFTGSTTHIWLTFVTESGRVFDLDLSAAQFGPSLPFPCILPVDINGDISKCFNGMCKRDRIVTSTLKELEYMVDELITTHVTMVTGMTYSNKDLKVEGVKFMFRRVVELVSNPTSLNELPMFDNPHYFWNVLCNLEVSCD